MPRFNLNHWFVNDNTINISLMRWYVGIKPIIENNIISKCELVVRNGPEIYLNLEFDNFEEAVVFIEDIINECHEVDEIVEKYYEIKHNKPKTRKKTK